MVKNENSAKTPLEKYEEAAFELACYRLLQEEHALMEHDPAAADAYESSADEKEFTYKMNRLIDAECRKEFHGNVLRVRGVQFLKVAMLIILIANMALTVAVASSSTIRVQVLRFLTHHTSSYMRISLSPDETAVEIPSDWPEKYFPTYIPQGFTLKETLPIEGFACVIYKNDSNQQIEIDVFGPGTVSQIDSEDADISYINIQDYKATVLQKNKVIRIIWNAGDRFIMVESNIDYQSTVDVAKSVSLIRR